MSRPFIDGGVLHDSGPELAALLPTLERHAPDAQLSSSTRARATTAGPRARHGAELIEMPDNPGFGAANNAGVARARHDVTVLLNPDTELVDQSLHELAARRESILVPCTPRACSSPTAPSSAPPTRSPAPSGRSARARAPAAAAAGAARSRRALPRRAPAHRRLGDRRMPGRPDAALLRGLGPFDPAVHLFAEDMELGLRARALGIPTVLHPQLRVRHTGGHASCATASRSRCSPAAAARRSATPRPAGPHARRRRPGVTFATRIAARAALGRDASRERAQLAALRREIGN